MCSMTFFHFTASAICICVVPFITEDRVLTMFMWILMMCIPRVSYLIKRQMSRGDADGSSQSALPQEITPRSFEPCTSSRATGVNRLSRCGLGDSYMEVKSHYYRLIQEKYLRSHRGAKMMYADAAATERNLSCWIFLVKLVLYVVPFLILKTVGYNLGVPISGAAAFVCELIDRYDNPLRDYLRTKSTVYIETASEWQKLNETAQCYLLKFENPRMTIAEMEELYMKLADERAKITSKVIVSENTYERVTVAMAIDDLKKRNDDLNKFVDFANSQR